MTAFEKLAFTTGLLRRTSSALHHLCFHAARTNGVDANALLGVLQGSRAHRRQSLQKWLPHRWLG